MLYPVPMNWYNLTWGKICNIFLYVLAVQHPFTPLIRMTFSVCLENPPSFTLSLCGTTGLHSLSRHRKRRADSGLANRALRSFGPRDIFGDGLWSHQNQGNLWPQVRTLPAGWGWSWIYEDVGAGMASLIFWLHGVWNRPTKWGIRGG